MLSTTTAAAKAKNILGHAGRMISASKGQYSYDNKENVVVFNANVCTKKAKIWHGDLDITVDEDKIIQLAEDLGERLYVLYESDGRFENEEKPLIEAALYSVDANGEVALNSDRNFERKKGRLFYKLEKVKKKKKKLYNKESEFKEDEFIHTLKFPKEDVFTKIKHDPMTNFYGWLKTKLKIKDKDMLINPSKIYISEDNYEKMSKYTKKWLKKKEPGLTAYRLQSSVSWFMFDVAPSVFYGGLPPWADKDVVYVKPDFAVKKETSAFDNI